MYFQPFSKIFQLYSARTENGAAQIRLGRVGEDTVQGPVLSIELVTLVLVQVS
jgi:hypothetical protein